MSILLEALKKSEQQRQLGKTPTLQTTTESAESGQSGPGQWVIPLMVVLSLAAMTWFGWQQYRAPETIEVAQSGDGNAVTEKPKPVPRTMTETYKAPQTSGRASLGVPPIIAGKDQKNVQEEDKSRLNKSFVEFAAKDTGQEKPGIFDSSNPDDNTAGSDQPEVVRPTSRGTGEAPDQVEESNRVLKATSTQTKLEPHVSRPISYWELPQGIRDNLPEIKITVLVFAENAKDRFLLTNGQRLIEKDELQSGLVLDEIRRDGAVFTYRKYRFFVSS